MRSGYARTVSAPSTEPAPPTQDTGPRPVVVVVDDEPVILDLLVTVLDDGAYDVRPFTRGAG